MVSKVHKVDYVGGDDKLTEKSRGKDYGEVRIFEQSLNQELNTIVIAQFC